VVFGPQTIVLREYGVNFNTARGIIKGKAVNINLKVLNKICIALRCTPNGILNYENTNDEIEPTHLLNKFTKKELPDVTDILRNLSPKKLTELLNMMSEKEEDVENTRKLLKGRLFYLSFLMMGCLFLLFRQS